MYSPSATLVDSKIISLDLFRPVGMIPWTLLYFICNCLRFSVLSMVLCMEFVIRTKPFTLRAARPTVCTNDLSFLKKPSLSASKIATNETSGRSNPSLSRFTPIRTSKVPSRNCRKISTRSMVSISLCM